MRNQNANQAIGQIGVGEKVGFGLGDFACNLIYASLSSYLLFFYTDVFGLSAGAASLLFLVVRFIDAFSDPIIGFFVDKSNTRWGKYRPFLLYGAIPFAILAPALRHRFGGKSAMPATALLSVC